MLLFLPPSLACFGPMPTFLCVWWRPKVGAALSLLRRPAAPRHGYSGRRLLRRFRGQSPQPRVLRIPREWFVNLVCFVCRHPRGSAFLQPENCASLFIDTFEASCSPSPIFQLPQVIVPKKQVPSSNRRMILIAYKRVLGGSGGRGGGERGECGGAAGEGTGQT